ncbi:MAG: hypothetical protein WBA84_10090 [Carnobacterium sp.]
MENLKIKIEVKNLDEVKKLIEMAKNQSEQLEQTLNKISEFEPILIVLTS